MEMSKAQIAKLKKWIELSPDDRSITCPFYKIYPNQGIINHHCKNFCYELFSKTRKGYCPEEHYTPQHIVKKIKKEIENG